MTTPAQNINAYGNRYYVYDRRFNGVIDWHAEGNLPILSRFFRRPASINNPIRADGTRAPSNWTAAWEANPGFMGTSGLFYRSGWGLHQETQTGPVLYLNRETEASQLESIARGMQQNTRIAALSKVSENQKQLNAAMLQMKGTVGLANQFARAASSRLNRVMDGRNGLFKRLGGMSGWKELPSEYLAYLYGIAPLGDDLSGALDKLAWMNQEGMSLGMTLKARRKNTVSIRVPAICMLGGAASAPFAMEDLEGEARIETRCSFHYDIPSWYLDRAPIVAPFSTAYELAPYSFVVDWFLPVGNYIGALESLQYHPFYTEGSESVFIEVVYDASTAVVKSNNLGGYCHATGTLTSGTFRRTTNPTYPLAQLPTLNPLPGLSQAAQGLALLTQAFKRWR